MLFRPRARAHAWTGFLLLTFAACAGDVGDPGDDGLALLDASDETPANDTPDDGAVTPRDAGTDAARPSGNPPTDAGSPANPGVVAAGVRWIGRVDLSDVKAPRFSWSGTGFVARFRGTGLRVQLNNSGSFRFKAVIDGAPQETFAMSSGDKALASGLPAGEHVVAFYRQSEGGQGDSQLTGLSVDGGELLSPPPPPARLIELIGDSISAGFGTLGKPTDTDCFATETHWDTYGAVAARALDAELSTVASSGQGAYRDYQGDTNGTLQRVYERARTNSETPKWSFEAQPQVAVINLGTNDVGRASTDPGQPYRDAYRKLVQTVRGKYPAARIVGTIGPMLGGSQLAAIRGHIAAVMDELRAAGDDRVSTYFGFETQTTDKFGCASHPNVAENLIMGQQLTAELKRLLSW